MMATTASFWMDLNAALEKALVLVLGLCVLRWKYKLGPATKEVSSRAQTSSLLQLRTPPFSMARAPDTFAECSLSKVFAL